MNNLSSYCGLVDAKIRACDKDLPVQELQIIHLKKYVELNMEMVELESKKQKKESIIEDALSACIKAAVIFVEAKRGENKFKKYCMG